MQGDGGDVYDRFKRYLVSFSLSLFVLYERIMCKCLFAPPVYVCICICTCLGACTRAHPCIQSLTLRHSTTNHHHAIRPTATQPYNESSTLVADRGTPLSSFPRFIPSPSALPFRKMRLCSAIGSDNECLDAAITIITRSGWGKCVCFPLLPVRPCEPRLLSACGDCGLIWLRVLASRVGLISIRTR